MGVKSYPSHHRKFAHATQKVLDSQYSIRRIVQIMQLELQRRVDERCQPKEVRIYDAVRLSSHLKGKRTHHLHRSHTLLSPPRP